MAGAEAFSNAEPAGRAAGPGLILGVGLCLLAAAAPGARAQQAAPATPGPPAAGGTNAAPNSPAGAQAPATAGNAAPNGQAAPAATNPPLIILPQLTLGEQFTDNALATAKQRKSDAISTIEPSLYLNADTPLIVGSLSYSPQLLEHAAISSQNQLNQNLLGNGTATLINDLFFVDLNATAQNLSRFGQRGFDNQAQVPVNQSTQSVTYSGSPYLRWQMGDSYTGEARYTYSASDFFGNTGAITDPNTGLALGSLSNEAEQSAAIKLSTGDAFNRLQLTLNPSYTRDQSGNSALDSRHTLATASGSYQLTNSLYALFGGGYEKLDYPMQPGLDFAGANWDFGGKFQPNDTRLISLTWGRSEGRFAFSGLAQYAVSPLTSFSIQYTDQNSTEQQQLLNSALNTAPGQPGGTQTPGNGTTTPVNPTTGLPTTVGNPNLALQNSVFEAKTLDLTANYTGLLDTFTLAYNHTQQLGLSVGSVSQTSNGGSLTWLHDISDAAKTQLAAGYSRNSITGIVGGHTATITLVAGYTYLFSDTLASTFSYSLTRTAGGPTGTVFTDLLGVQLTKSF